MAEIDVSKDLDALRAAAMKVAKAPPSLQKAVERKKTPRETPVKVTICDPWTGEAVQTYVLTSRVLEGPELAQAVRYAASLAGVPMDSLDHNDRQWFKTLAKAEIQIRDVSALGWMVDESAEKRKAAFMAMLWSDPELLAFTNRGLEEHEARFRVGNPREGEGEAKFGRVVVSAIGDP